MKAGGRAKLKRDETDGLVMVQIGSGRPESDSRLLADIGESLGARVMRGGALEGGSGGNGGNVGLLFLNGAHIGTIDPAPMAEAIRRNGYAPFRRGKRPCR